MFVDDMDGLAVRFCRHVCAQLRNPAAEQSTALLTHPFVDDRSQVSQTIDLWDERAQSSAAPNDADDVLAAQDVRLSHAKFAQFGPHLGRNWRIHTHVGHKDVGVRLPGFNEFLDITDLSGQVADLERLSGIRGVLALDRADELLITW